MTTLNKIEYTKLINEDIAEINKYMPEHSLEKEHIIATLKWSIKQLYEQKQPQLLKIKQWESKKI